MHAKLHRTIKEFKTTIARFNVVDNTAIVHLPEQQNEWWKRIDKRTRTKIDEKMSKTTAAKVKGKNKCKSKASKGGNTILSKRGKNEEISKKRNGRDKVNNRRKRWIIGRIKHHVLKVLKQKTKESSGNWKDQLNWCLIKSLCNSRKKNPF